MLVWGFTAGVLSRCSTWVAGPGRGTGTGSSTCRDGGAALPYADDAADEVIRDRRPGPWTVTLRGERRAWSTYPDPAHVVFAINGYRQGFVIGALSFVGFFCGALIGLQIGPLVASQFVDAAAAGWSSRWCRLRAGRGRTGARRLGRHPAAPRDRRQVGQRVDDVGGALVSVFALLLVAWLVAVPLASSSLPAGQRRYATA